MLIKVDEFIVNKLARFGIVPVAMATTLHKPVNPLLKKRFYHIHRLVINKK